jgi:hypothetical protein
VGSSVLALMILTVERGLGEKSSFALTTKESVANNEGEGECAIPDYP